MKLDLSKFKKIASDKIHTTMEHEDGHIMKIAHGALSPKMRAEMAKLPLHKGKKVDHTPEAMAEGGEVEPKGQWVAKGTDEEKRKKAAAGLGKAFGFAEGGDVPKREDDFDYMVNSVLGSPEARQSGFAAEQASLPESPVSQAPAPMAPVMEQPQGQGMENATVNAPAEVSTAAVPEPQSQPINSAPSTEGGYEKQVTGINEEANAKAQEGQQQAAAIKQQLGQVNKLMTDYQSHYQDLDKERKAFQDDIINKHIDPQHYMGSMDTEGRFNTAVGLILGGLGGGLQGTGQNAALDFLNKQIDRDIDAQKAELGKKETLLSANMRQFGNLKDATEMTKIMQNDMLINKLKMAEANAASPIAKARAQQQIGQLEMQVAPMVQQLATRRMLASGEGNGQLSQMDPSKLIPSVVPKEEQQHAFKELKEAQDLSAAKHNVLDAFNKLSQINTVGNRLANPIQSARQVSAIKDPLVAELSKATAGRFTEQDAKFLDSLFPKYGDNSETLGRKKIAVDKLISEKMHFPILSAYGLDPEKFASTSGSSEAKLSPQQQSFVKWAKENPKDPRSALILKKLGLE